jgi:hypothetical protein
VQPFNSHQQTFRYFSDSKRPFVVSFRRVNKVTLPNNNNNNSSLNDRCSSICDIHRYELDEKNRHCRQKNPYKQNGSQSCRNFNYLDGNGKAKAHFDNEESPQHDRNRITITYPKEKFHGNAKLLLTFNADDVLKFNNRYSINTTASNLFFTTSAEQNRKFSHYLNEDTAVRQMNKSTSTPILNKLDKSLDFELKERKQSFVSILNVRAKEAHLVRNSKSY